MRDAIVLVSIYQVAIIRCQAEVLSYAEYFSQRLYRFLYVDLLVEGPDRLWAQDSRNPEALSRYNLELYCVVGLQSASPRGKNAIVNKSVDSGESLEIRLDLEYCVPAETKSPVSCRAGEPARVILKCVK